MSLLIFALIVLLIVGLCVWGVRALPLGEPYTTIASIILIIIAVVVIAQRAGFL